MLRYPGLQPMSQALKQRVLAFARMLHAVPLPDALMLPDRPQGPRVLVLAPHPDDEVIGCGGTLRKHCLAGDAVSCIYLTSGESSSGFPRLDAGTRGALREKEAMKGAELIGIEHLVFLRQQDGALQPADGVVDAVVRVMETLRPNLVYLPSFLERQPDHLQANLILRHACRRLSGALDFSCAGYETLSPLVANCAVDITEQVSVKRSALEEHRIPNDAINIVDTVIGLNRWRSLSASHGDGYAEAYFYATAADYFDLAEQVLDPFPGRG